MDIGGGRERDYNVGNEEEEEEQGRDGREIIGCRLGHSIDERETETELSQRFVMRFNLAAIFYLRDDR